MLRPIQHDGGDYTPSHTHMHTKTDGSGG
jgi:hypothetical protein